VVVSLDPDYVYFKCSLLLNQLRYQDAIFTIGKLFSWAYMCLNTEIYEGVV